MSVAVLGEDCAFNIGQFGDVIFRPYMGLTFDERRYYSILRFRTRLVKDWVMIDDSVMFFIGRVRCDCLLLFWMIMLSLCENVMFGRQPIVSRG